MYLHSTAPGKTKKETISLASDISEHAKQAFHAHYKYPYEATGKVRSLHGISHVSRVAFYIPVLANLYRRYEHPLAVAREGNFALTDENIKLLQITALFHDSGRQGDGPDTKEWEAQSAKNLFHYLTETLGVPKEKAQIFHDVIINKDVETPARNIFQKFLYDADGLDVKRARPRYDGSRLEFYKDIACRDSKALGDMVQTIVEVRGVIAMQGDCFKAPNDTIKRIFDHEDGYQVVARSILANEQAETKILHTKMKYPLLSKMYGGGKLLPSDSLKMPLEIEHFFDSKAEEPLILARAITYPSAIHPKLEHKKTLAAFDLYKGNRRLGVPSFKGNLNKDGNPVRSASIVNGWGEMFACAGFLIFNPEMANIGLISNFTLRSGVGKKGHLRSVPPVVVTDEQKKEKIAEVIRLQRLGGGPDPKDSHQYAYSEVLVHVKSYDHIFFSRDRDDAHSPALQAIFLQTEFNKTVYSDLNKGKSPKIYEYSAINRVLRERTFKPEDIIKMWSEMCMDCIRKNGVEIFDKSLAEIKVLAMYGRMTGLKNEKLIPADINFSPEMQARIDAAIKNELEHYFIEYLKDAPPLPVAEILRSPLTEVPSIKTNVIAWIKKHHSEELRNPNPNPIKEEYYRIAKKIPSEEKEIKAIQTSICMYAIGCLSDIREYYDTRKLLREYDLSLKESAFTPLFETFNEQKKVLKNMLVVERIVNIDVFKRYCAIAYLLDDPEFPPQVLGFLKLGFSFFRYHLPIILDDLFDDSKFFEKFLSENVKELTHSNQINAFILEIRDKCDSQERKEIAARVIGEKLLLLFDKCPYVLEYRRVLLNYLSVCPENVSVCEEVVMTFLRNLPTITSANLYIILNELEFVDPEKGKSYFSKPAVFKCIIEKLHAYHLSSGESNRFDQDVKEIYKIIPHLKSTHKKIIAKVLESSSFCAEANITTHSMFPAAAGPAAPPAPRVKVIHAPG